MARRRSSFIAEATGMMTQLCRKIVRVNIRWSVLERVTIFRKLFRFIWDRILACSIGRPIRYRRLSQIPSSSSPSPEMIESGLVASGEMCSGYDTDSDLVSLKISLLGDCQIGKTSFVVSEHLHIQYQFLSYIYRYVCMRHLMGN